MKTVKLEISGGRKLPRDFTFHVRPDTSDEKAIREVISRRGYAKHGFVPQADEVWIDLGANIGAFSVWAAAHDKSIQVHAYEPDPEMCELIERNAKANKVSKQITITQAAVVADGRKKTVVLHKNVARGNVWRSSIEREWRGQEDIVVPTLSVRKAYDVGDNVKMDIEGTEMPILEWMIESTRIPASMVFEWSFDVDNSIPRFRAVIDGLRGFYDQVTYGGFDESATEWQPSWFPPCRLVWCWNES